MSNVYIKTKIRSGNYAMEYLRKIRKKRILAESGAINYILDSLDSSNSVELFDQAIPDPTIEIVGTPGPADTEKVVLGEGGIASGAPEGTVVVNMSTVDPGVNIRMGEALAPKGIDFVDAPVMGSPSGVGSWAFALGGSDEALAKIKDVLLVLSGSEEKLFHIGPLGHGNKLKLLNNMMLGAIDACAAETMALAEHMGLSQKTLIDVAVAANARVLSSAYKEIGTRIAEGRYDEPTFTVDMLIKDNRLCLDMAREYGAPLILGAAVDYVHRMVSVQGYGAKDHAVSWKAVAKNWKA